MRSSNFRKITDPKEILETLRLYMSNDRPKKFIPNIHTKKESNWGICNIEASRPFSIAGPEEIEAKIITLTNADSDYMQRIGFIELRHIDWLEV
jgi:hypothetical protein